MDINLLKGFLRRFQKVPESKSQGHIVMQGTFRLCAFLRVEIGMHKDRTLQYDLINHYESFQIFLAACMQLQQLACSYSSLHAVTVACMQLQ